MGDIADEHVDRLAEEGWFHNYNYDLGYPHFHITKKRADKYAAEEFLLADVEEMKYCWAHDEYSCEHCEVILIGFSTYQHHLRDTHGLPRSFYEERS